ncbi:hypothetical protein E2562_014751, partial [Oryza meyeriana var. granulata]
MWRRAGPLRLHLVAAAGAAGCGARRNPLQPVPTVPSSSSASDSHSLGAFPLGSSTGGGECWSCGARGAFLSCGSCGSVQPVDPVVDYFRIFGLQLQTNMMELREAVNEASDPQALEKIQYQ